MFKIIELEMFSPSDEKFTYKFKSGINYFKGGNSTGKTEFYKFIDFMYGSSEDISKKKWFKDSLKKAKMVFEYKNIKYCIIRTLDKDKNYFYYENDSFDEEDYIPLNIYKEKLNAVFSTDDVLKELKEFTNENLTYRTFTMFNFLGEKRQGVTYNFLDKCSDVKYHTKLNSVLNYIFNKNIDKIFEIQRDIDQIEIEIKKLKEITAKYSFIKNQVNSNLKILNSSKTYNGANTEEILEFIKKYKQLKSEEKVSKSKTIADLEFTYNEIDEQIKIYENRKKDSKEILKEYENRKEMLESLNELLDKNEGLAYLIEPLHGLLNEMDESISFSKFLIKDKTIIELKKERENLKELIHDNEYRFQIFSIDEKNKALILIEEYLNEDIKDVDKDLKMNVEKLKSLKNELKKLQNEDNKNKIDQFSKFITELYTSAYEVSDIVETDVNEKGFKIQYIKRGNVLQSQIKKDENGSHSYVNYFMGSMARHTLIQLSGYLAFIRILISENRTPLIPFLIFDHISKPFDSKNIASIGEIFSKFYQEVSKEDVQMFIFDDKEYTELELEVDTFHELKNNKKTGFNPFYVE